MGFYKVFTNQDNYFDSGFIALSKEDLLSLIEYLTELSDELDDSNDKF